MVKRVDTLICQVADMDRAVAFYRDVLGLTPGYISPYWSDFRLGDIRIGLHPPMEGSTPPYGIYKKGWFLGIEVESVSALREKLLASGATVLSEFHQTPSGTVFDFSDPDGNVLQALEKTTH